MENSAFVIERTFRAPVAKVWKAITDRDEMKKWYFDLSAFKAEPGFRFEFVGEGHDCEKYIHLCEVKEVIPEQKLSYSWTYKNYEGYSVVTFELFEEDEQTRLRLTHEGLESFPQNNPDFARASFSEGWNFIIGTQLVNYLS